MARPIFSDAYERLQNRRGSFVAAAESVLLALAEGRDAPAWEHAQALAKAVDDTTYVLATSVLDGGPFAMRKAEELAELVLADEGVEAGSVDEEALS